MCQYLRYVTKAVLLLCVLWTSVPTAQGKEITHPTPACPIGFTLVQRKDKNSPLCLRKKDPESFSDIYRNCVGNLYTSKLYQELEDFKSNDVIWTEYKSAYPGGFFIDWSHTKTIGTMLDMENDVAFDPTVDLGEELCLVIDPVTNFTAVKCNEKHYRYCVVNPYVPEDSLTNKGCKGLEDSVRFWSPVSTCLTSLIGVGGGSVRATWNQAEALCERKGGLLLNRGWRYSNYKKIRYANSVNHTYPLGIVMSTDYTLLRYVTTDNSEVPPTEWRFGYLGSKDDMLLGSLRNDFWHLVNSSYIFYDVICEREVNLKSITLSVTVDIENKITLTVNDSLDIDDIYCFTESVSYYPVKVKKERVDKTNVYVLKPKHDGYYWCTHNDIKNYVATQSKKVLFIREKDSLVNFYTIKVKFNKMYRLDEINKIYKTLELNLTEYIYLRTKYVSVHGEDAVVTEKFLKNFKKVLYGTEWRPDSVIVKMKIKRLYIDRRSVLIHVELHPDMKPVTTGSWQDIEILFMKPVFYCKGFDAVPQLPLGNSTNTVGCRTHSCIGDFNEGVQWITTATTNCTTRSPVAVDRSLDVDGHDFTFLKSTLSPEPTHEEVAVVQDNTSESSDEELAIETTSTRNDKKRPTSTTRPTPPEVTTPIIPTEVSTVNTPEIYNTTTEVATTVPDTTTLPPTTRPPSEQLEQVINDLDKLINATNPISVDDIGDVFNQVDDLFELHDNLDIPGRLLHLLDNLGSAIELNGSRSAAAVRNNIALLLADAEPNHPVRGMKIATRNTDMFTNDAFQIISGEINSTMLDSESNEVVVHLPQSVSDSSRRISFVVFRNDRAFQPSEGTYSVNSRVLSIKVEDVTKFENGEVIDIHLSPVTTETGRNMSRTCAYWQFLEDGTGYWSSDGCTLIHANKPGVLDTCRCTHLTHFAEVLFPRAVFSERNEDILELLTIIGCCISLFGLTMVGVTAALFRSWRRDYSNKIWLQLCISIFLLVLSFLIIIFARFDQYSIPCMLIGVMLHYSVLSSFCWMLVAAVLSYRRLVLVFTRDASHKLLRASAFSWGVPCAIIGILLSAAPHSYAGRFEEKTPNGSFCYPSGLSMWLAVYAPIAIILLANWTLFVLIVRSVFASRGIQRHGDSNEAFRCASVSCLLVFLFGLPWIFGLFAFNIVAAYFFTLTATYQGFVLFIFFVLNKKTRDLWLNKLKIKQTRKVPVTSSTYSNRSTGWRGGGTQPLTVEAKVSKPKSLNQDDSRFS